MSQTLSEFGQKYKWYADVRARYEKTALKNYFNLLDEIGSNVKEMAHTNILMRLLEFREGNSLPLLKSFFERFINIHLTSTGANFDKERYYLKTASDSNWRRPYNDNKIFQSGQEGKKYSKEVSRIDGIIFKKGAYAIILENKINRAPEQSGQIDRYIDAVLNDKEIDINNIKQVYVVYLQREDKTVPSSKSLDKYRKTFVHKSDNSTPFSHLILCNYDDILEWLEEDVLNFLRVKDQDYITGVKHYISFLKNALGRNSYQLAFQADMDKLIGNKQIRIEETSKEIRDLLAINEDTTVADEISPLDISVLQELDEYFIKKKYSDYIDVLAKIDSLEDPKYYITSSGIYMRFWDKKWNGKSNTIFFIWWLNNKSLEFHIEGKVFKENRDLILSEFNKAAIDVECLPRGEKDEKGQWGVSVQVGEAGNRSIDEAIGSFASLIDSICKVVSAIRTKIR